MTSNYHPDDLYPDGLQRERFPADHRAAQGAARRRRGRRRHRLPPACAASRLQVYHTPLGTGDRRGADGEAFGASPTWRRSSHELDVEGRVIPTGIARAAWSGSTSGCCAATAVAARLPRPRQALSHGDRLGRAALSPTQPRRARRFTLLVDVFYDSASSSSCRRRRPSGQLLGLDAGRSTPVQGDGVRVLPHASAGWPRCRPRDYMMAAPDSSGLTQPGGQSRCGLIWINR